MSVGTEWMRASGLVAILVLAASPLRAGDPVARSSRGPVPPDDAGAASVQERADGGGLIHPGPGPIADSVDSAVAEVIEKHFPTCGHADEGVPCFPVTVERRWQYSVADSLRHLEFDSSPSPSRPPTVDEMKGARPGPLSASGGVGFDPICTGKAIVKSITGRTRTFYLYRVWDEEGERALMRETPIEAETFGGTPSVRYVELGTFRDECKALAAWRKALRETRARRTAAGEAESEDHELPEGAAEAPGEPAAE